MDLKRFKNNCVLWGLSLVLASAILVACGSGAKTDNMVENEAVVDPQTEKMDSIMTVCLSDTSRNPIEVLERLMSLSFCPMHGPDHHLLVGVALLTAYHNAGGEVESQSALEEMVARGREVPGGACGYWGACGAAISAGMFLSIVTENTPISTESWRLCNMMTSEALAEVANHGGPRCCKRDSYLSILTAVDFVKEHLGVEMEKTKVECTRSGQNKQCIGTQCPFNQLR